MNDINEKIVILRSIEDELICDSIKCSQLNNVSSLINTKLLLAISEKLLEIPNNDLTENQKKQVIENTLQALNRTYFLTEAQPRLHAQTISLLVKLYTQQNNDGDGSQFLINWLNNKFADDRKVFLFLDSDKKINNDEQLNKMILACLNSSIKNIEKSNIKDAKLDRSDDLLMQLELQSADLLYNNGDYDKALQAYRLAAEHLNKIRYNIPIILQNGKSSIQEFIIPIYRGLADILLLKSTDKKTESLANNDVQEGLKEATEAQKQEFRKEAIEAMDRIKETELEDFFKDRCLLDEAKNQTFSNLIKEKISSKVAVIYPVILEDRLELLFRVGDSTDFQQKTIPDISEEDVDSATDNMLDFLTRKTTNSNKAVGLYEWLLEPYNKTLKEKEIKTIIYVPDGMLRKIPFAALFNEYNRYAVEDYAIVTLPELKLKKIDSYKKQNLLIAALSKPDGPSIKEVMRFSSAPNENRGFRNTINDCQNSSNYQACIICQDTSLDIKVRESACVDIYALKGVDSEVNALTKITPNNETLRNTDFTHQKFENELKRGRYSNVHIASHGVFGENAEKSFIMLYDKLLYLNEIQSLLNESIKDSPVDLLTLSACQTAEGNDRALLGFSGIAIKSNVASAIGTLWPVNDEATAKFMQNFYSNLAISSSKAEALRKTQLSFIDKDNKFQAPVYWAPFILVGQWE
jgi:CHAT domain-containing protein